MLSPEQVVERAERVRVLCPAERELAHLTVKVEAGHGSLAAFAERLKARLADFKDVPLNAGGSRRLCERSLALLSGEPPNTSAAHREKSDGERNDGEGEG